MMYFLHRLRIGMMSIFCIVCVQMFRASHIIDDYAEDGGSGEV